MIPQTLFNTNMFIGGQSLQGDVPSLSLPKVTVKTEEYRGGRQWGRTGAMALEIAVVPGFGQQDAIGHQLDQGIGVTLIFKPHLIADVQAPHVMPPIPEPEVVVPEPVIAPEPARGEPLYALHCSVCHGATGAGDGPASMGMTPPPANLRDAARLDRLSLYAIYNTLGLGVEGTDMPSFADQLHGYPLDGVVLTTGCDKTTPADRKSTRLNSSHYQQSRMPSSA